MVDDVDVAIAVYVFPVSKEQRCYPLPTNDNRRN
jgi:hypothetical protein